MIKWIKDKYIGLLFWWHKSKLERGLDKELRFYTTGTVYEIFQDDTERKYAEGVATIKGKVKKMASEDGDYERVLEEVKELIQLARDETPSQRAIRQALISLARLPEKSKKKMIQERIQHYEELRKYNEERALIKEIKQARKEGKTDLAEELETKWRQTYGKVRNLR